MKIHERLLDDEAVAHIKSGKKNLIVEPVPSDLRGARIQVNDIIVIEKNVRRLVKAVRRYPSFDAMLEKEDADRIYPDRNKYEARVILHRAFSKKQEQRGVFVYEIEPILRIVGASKK